MFIISGLRPLESHWRMKRNVEKLSESIIRQDYPLVGNPVGWFFRVSEVASGVYRVEGTDLWGRKVSRTGSDADALLAECSNDASVIDAR